MSTTINVTELNDIVQINVTETPENVTINIVEGVSGSGGNEGINQFIQLIDTPVSYDNKANYLVKVNLSGNSLEFLDPSLLTIYWDRILSRPASSVTEIDNTVIKVAGIQSGAEVNVQSDWNAVSGDALILNKPTDVTDLSLYDTDDLSEGTTNLYNRIPTGGTAGQVLSKVDGTDYNLAWADASGDLSTHTWSELSDVDNLTATGGNILPTGTQHTQNLGGSSNYFHDAFITQLNIRNSATGSQGSIIINDSGDISLNPAGTILNLDRMRMVDSGTGVTLQTAITEYSLSISASSGGTGAVDGGRLRIYTQSGGTGGDTDGGDIQIYTGAGNGTGTYGNLRLSSGGAVTMVKQNDSAANVLTVNTTNGLVEYRDVNTIGSSGGIGSSIWW